MSFDLAASSTPCDNLNVLERYRVSPLDFRTLLFAENNVVGMRAPINAPSMLRLYFKGSLVHPSHPLYGYAIVPDTTRIQSPYPYSKILFTSPVRLVNPLIEVSYFTMKGFCRKCGGSGSVVDWQVSPSGALNRVVGVRKLAQQSLKYVLASRNPFNPQLVCPIRSYLNRKVNSGLTDEDISSAVMSALASYQSIQRAQQTVQTMDPTEMIKDIVAVGTQTDPNDPTRISVLIEITAYGSNQVIPLTVALQTTS